MTAQQSDVIIIGGGIIGLATARAIGSADTSLRVTVIEKEADLAHHQTGNNSGVLHSGIYYRPGSLKASLCRAGNAALVDYCEDRGIPYEVCGKVIVATESEEVARLEVLHERALAHGLEVERLGPSGLADHEPNIAGVAGLWLPSTGIVDYVAVARSYGDDVVANGGVVLRSTRVESIERIDGSNHVATTAGDHVAPMVVNCAGLHSDRMVVAAGGVPEARIVPFRGEYYELADDRRDLVKGLIYPVPDPDFPFLGVHFTKMIDRSVHCGPNAVLALKREGYRKRDINARDLWDTLSYAGFWRLARKHGRAGAAEMARSASKRLFLRSLQRLIPDVALDDLVPTHAGVRAQALRPDGGLVDDFLIVENEGFVHVCNAPSPAATSSMEIGRSVAETVLADGAMKMADTTRTVLR